MDEYQSLSHTRWECKYHVVFIPKCRRRDIVRGLKSSDVHVHMILIPPKYAVSQVIGFIKGKSAIHLARVYGERKRNFVGQHFWARGILRLDDRARRSRHQGVHPEARAGGPAPRSDEFVALTSHRQVAPTLRGRVSGPNSRFERPHH